MVHNYLLIIVLNLLFSGLLSTGAYSAADDSAAIDYSQVSRSPLSYESMATKLKNFSASRQDTIPYEIVQNVFELRKKLEKFADESVAGESRILVVYFPMNRHFCLVFGTNIGGQAYFILFDSLGYEGKFSKNIVEDAFEPLANARFLAIGPNRQFDDFSCSIFTMDDFIFLNNIPSPTALIQDLIKYGDIKTSEGSRRVEVINRPPCGLMHLFQSGRLLNGYIEAMKAVQHIISEEESQYSQLNLEVLESIARTQIVIMEISVGHNSPVNQRAYHLRLEEKR